MNLLEIDCFDVYDFHLLARIFYYYCVIIAILFRGNTFAIVQ